MQRTPHRCPCCSQPLGISWDMWGAYYVCQGCGFAAEDDDDVAPRAASQPPKHVAFLTTPARSAGTWQVRHER